MKLPTREECFALWDKYEMPENIRQHCMVVEKISVFLAKKLKERGEEVNLELVERGALLHDIGKIFEIRKTKAGGGHGEIGREILLKEGYLEIAEVCRKHVLKYFLISDWKTWTWEERLVQYADDRVNHDKIVSLDERYEYLLETYGGHVENSKPFVFALEREIFGIIGGKPEFISKL